MKSHASAPRLVAFLAVVLAPGFATVLKAEALTPDENAGLVIGDIRIDNENIFDTRDPREDKRLFRLANRLHYRTRDSVIRNQLLFRSGDPYTKRLLEESERILRGARYLYDASIRVVAVHDGRVDVEVTTRDVWTLNPGVSYGRHGGKNTGGFELEELNLLGTGVAISAGHTSGLDRQATTFAVRDKHLGANWWNVTALYSSNSDGNQREFELTRPFYSLNTRWSTGLTLLNDDRVDSLYDRGEIVDQFRHQQKYVDLFGGWSKGLRDGWVERWRVGGTYEDDHFIAAPDWTGATVLPDARKWVYPWIEYSLMEDDFETLQNRDQIGRTEDFHFGTQASLKLGWADTALGSKDSALLVTSELAHGFALSDRSTLLADVNWTARLQSGSWQDSLADASLRYYVKQSNRFLFFATIDGSVGHRLDLDHPLLLGGDNGLRGYPLRYQGGDRRVLMTVEQRFFSDWYPFRLFRVGAAAFIDVGRTWGEAPLGAPNLGWLKDVGFGLRFGNSRSGLGNIVHVDVAFPLDGDPSIKKVQFIVETKQRF